MCYKKLVIRATSGDSATIYPVKTIKHICIAKVRSSHKPSPQALMQLSGVAFAKTIARAIAIKVNKHAIAKEPGFHRSQKRERLFAL